MGHRTTRKVQMAAVVAVLGMATLVGCSSSSSDDASSNPTEPSQAQGGGTINVLSYNVAGLPAEISKVRPDVNIPLISPKLDDYDVVLTQEDFDWWPEGGLADGLDFVNYHDRLRADTTYEYFTDVHPGPEAVGLDTANRPEPEIGDGLGVMSRYPIADTSRVPWTGCFGGFDTNDGGAADCLAMKGFSMTPMTVADGINIDVYNLHAEAGGTDLDQTLQVEDFAQLAQFMAANSEGNAVILAGDTNLHTDVDPKDPKDAQDSEIWAEFLAETGLTDACDATECAEPGRIDKAAVRSSDSVELTIDSWKFETDVFVDDAGEDLSDHQALHVVVGYRPL